MKDKNIQVATEIFNKENVYRDDGNFASEQVQTVHRNADSGSAKDICRYTAEKKLMQLY
jgi:hypothetical protein